MPKLDWIGRELGEYFIFEKIGLGSMAEVYKALQPSMDRMVAVKVISPALNDDPHFVARFRREAKIVATLEHPHILPVIDFGEQDDILYLVMRHVNGGTLHDLIQKGPLPPPIVLRYLTEIGEALDYAHGVRVVHRDIKPKNMLLDAQGNPFIADFGLARLIGGGGITGSGTGLIGTPHYMSPEQARGQHVDGRSDLYSLGVVLYEMLTGQVPFDADSTVGIVMKHIGEPVPDVSKLNPQLSPALNDVLSKALAKHPSDRYQTAHEMTEALARALGASVLSGPILSRTLDRPRVVSALSDELEHIREDLYRVNIAFRRWLKPRRRLKRLQDGFRSTLNTYRNWPRARRRRVLWTGGSLVALALLAFSFRAALTNGLAAAAVTPTATLRATAAPTQPIVPTAIPTTAPALAATETSATLAPIPIETLETPVISDRDKMVLLRVPAGTFLLGSADDDPGASEDEKPQQLTYLDAYWMDRTEVTVAQFQDFVNATGYATDAERGCCSSKYARAGGHVYSPGPVFVVNANWLQPQGGGGAAALPRQAVVQVSWNDAQKYCEWAGRRLPTEAEWDKAARGTDGRLYPWGNEFDGGQLNFCDVRCGTTWRDTAYDDKFVRTGNVASYLAGASPYGLFDMSGNVWEWVNDWYDFRGYYRYPPSNGTQPALRGGSWIDTFDRVRASTRWKLAPDARNNLSGFRCAADASAIP